MQNGPMVWEKMHGDRTLGTGDNIMKNMEGDLQKQSAPLEAHGLVSLQGDQS